MTLAPAALKLCQRRRGEVEFNDLCKNLRISASKPRMYIRGSDTTLRGAGTVAGRGGRARLAGLGLADPAGAADGLLLEARPLLALILGHRDGAGGVGGEEVGADLLGEPF